MKIEIWSDIVCPFCYIGKRKFEAALADFEHADALDIEWKSFQLNPNTITDPETSVYQNLAIHKGISVAEAEQMSSHVTEVAHQVGLDYDFDRAVVANTFKAHQLLHFAKKHGKQHPAKELLLRAYFTEGKNIDDVTTLVSLTKELELDGTAVRQMLESGSLADEVRTDIYEAQQLRISGVPFFVFDRKYGISGAQDPALFLQTLNKSFAEWQDQSVSKKK